MVNIIRDNVEVFRAQSRYLKSREWSKWKGKKEE